MSHDYDPNWDYPVLELADVPEIDGFDRTRIVEILGKVRIDLAPALNIEDFEAFFVEPCGFMGGSAVAIYCSGTSFRPIVGFDLCLMKQVAHDEGTHFHRQFEISLVHELAHAYQESLGMDHEHAEGFDEDDAEEFARDWADWRRIDVSRLQRVTCKDHPKDVAPI